MQIRGATPASCFGLRGTDENAGTAALGWCIDRAPALRREILRLFGFDPGLELVVSSQVYAIDRGFTDLELMSRTVLHVIIEAKAGWQVPSVDQLQRYAPRIHESKTRERLLVSVSAADSKWAMRHLPTEVDGIRVTHVSWSDLSSAARRALHESRSPLDKLWLDQLISHLSSYGMTSNVFDSRAYVVSLNRKRINADDPYTWTDVVETDRRYFHPVGVNGFPAVPPAYLGFSYRSEFRSAHFVESVLTTDHLQDIDSRWPLTSEPHFVYTLGPAMAPARAMKLGKIHASMRNTVALDLLLSGVADDYCHALQLMRERVAAIG
jgi:hypothetical protein